MKSRILKTLMLLFLCIVGHAAFAQITVSGVVSDAEGPIPGVNVLVRGTSDGTVTDFDGNYTIDNVPADGTLLFSFVGFATQQIDVNGRTTIDVTLSQDAAALEEVVVIGYGSTTVKDATGSVSSVTSEEFNNGVIVSPEQLIQGKTAGVNIQQTSGEPGAGISINIRGTKSVRANNNPLFVVDGVPLSGDNTSPTGDTGNGQTSARNPLNFLNPNDIESISILKDASATAIYGSRGANGVVIITTKKGTGAGKAGLFEFISNVSVATPANSYDLLDRNQFLTALDNFGGDADAVDFGADTDWQDFITRTTASTNNNLSYSNNYGKGNVRATFGYSKQFGVVEKTDLERITGRINARHRFFDDKLTVGVSATLSRINDETAPLSGGADNRGDILGASYIANPTWPLDPDFTNGDARIFPANLLTYSQNRTYTDRFLVNGSVEYKVTSDLTAKINLGYDNSDAENISVLSADVLGAGGITDLGFGVYNTLERTNRLLEGTLNYTKEFENSNVDVLVGYSFQDFHNEGRNAAGRGFSTRDLNQMGDDLEYVIGSANNAINGSFQQFFYDINRENLFVNRLLPEVVAGEEVATNFDRRIDAITADIFDNTDELQSFFGRINYTIAQKYLFTATVRADGSSRFGSENQYGIFPSGAFAWQLGEEDFIGDDVSTLKLRLSAGVVGNQDGLGYGNFVNRQRFTGLGIGNDLTINQNGIATVATDVPDLKWEPTLSLNFGIDFGFNNDRLNGSLDIYRDKTTDVLLRTPPAAPAVDPFQFGNQDAAIINQGIEFAIGYDWIQTEDINFSSSFNIAYNHNEVQDFSGAINTGQINGQGLTGAFAQRFEAGHSIFSYYMAEFAGFDEEGNETYVDQDGDGIGDPFKDKIFVGEDALPDVTTGLSLNLKVKNFDFNAFFSGQFGFSVYNNTANGFFTIASLTSSRNITQDALNTGEQAGSSSNVSTRFLEKGDFVRFQNASIGYNVPLSGEGTFKSLRLSVTGQNLFLITDYSGLDPEVTVATGDLGSGVPTRGIDWAAFPNPRTYTFGINATF